MGYQELSANCTEYDAQQKIRRLTTAFKTLAKEVHADQKCTTCLLLELVKKHEDAADDTSRANAKEEFQKVKSAKKCPQCPECILENITTNSFRMLSRRRMQQI